MDLIQQLQKEKESLQKRIDAINVLLDSSNTHYNESTGQPKQEGMSKFPKNGTQLEQIIYIIKSQNRFIHTSEIVDIIAPYYIDKDKIWLRSRISAILSNAKSKGLIPNLINKSYSSARKDNVWGSKDWLDEQGKIKPEYMYKPKIENEIEKPSL